MLLCSITLEHHKFVSFSFCAGTLFLYLRWYLVHSLNTMLLSLGFSGTAMSMHAWNGMLFTTRSKTKQATDQKAVVTFMFYEIKRKKEMLPAAAIAM